ncbi:MAG: hypothetical protein WAO52_02225 [Prolixibacteraceae bacterium]
MNTELLEIYQNLVSQYQTQSDLKKKQLKLISIARFFSFLSIIPAYYYLQPVNEILALAVSILLLASFLFLIKKFIQSEKLLNYNLRLVEINKNEIKAIQRDYSSFDPGNEFIDPHHDYSYDLDLFGPNSFFQFLNRTSTHSGKKQLAKLLNKSKRTEEEILENQSAIQELVRELNWRQQFLASGKETEEPGISNRIEASIGRTTELKSAKTLKIILNILPFVTVILIGLSIWGITERSYYLPAVFVQWALFVIYSKTISKFNKQFESQAKSLDRYAGLLRLIETKSFESKKLNRLKHGLSVQEKTASTITYELHKILNEFDYRQNIIVGFVLNSLFLWDIRCLIKLNDWQRNYSGELAKWLEIIAEMDALISLANLNYNHPDWVTPKPARSGFHLSARDLGHPLIDENRCVRNSFDLSGDEQIVIITGANMAGKSTFLRTVGVNLVLASMGCNVCSTNFEFQPVRVFTNMRTSDNLMNDESYFYAELLRLQSMLNLIRKGEQLFVIIDEMLKGTNSTDKLNGSKELIHQLISLKSHGIVATHDLALTELAEKLTEIKNQCFEVLLHNEELTFDYKLSDGVTRTMNATFLMKKMGIIPQK